MSAGAMSPLSPHSLLPLNLFLPPLTMAFSDDSSSIIRTLSDPFPGFPPHLLPSPNKRPDEADVTSATSTVLPDDIYVTGRLKPVGISCDLPRSKEDFDRLRNEWLKKNGSDEIGESSSSVVNEIPIRKRRGRPGTGRRDNGRMHGIPQPDRSLKCPICEVVHINKFSYSSHTRKHYSNETEEDKAKRYAARTARADLRLGNSVPKAEPEHRTRSEI